jgi:hypothetical protein
MPAQGSVTHPWPPGHDPHPPAREAGRGRSRSRSRGEGPVPVPRHGARV